MALITWKAVVGGDWSDAADWSTNTVPTSTDEAEFLAAGNYTVTVTRSETANALLFEAPGAELVESAAGALDLDEFILFDGSVELDGTNAIGLTELDGGVLTLGDAAALGGGDLAIGGGELLSTVSQTLTNPLSMSGGFTIAAAPGTTLDFDGSAGWSLAGGATVDFGAPGVNGVVVWHTPSGSSGNGAAVDVRGGVLRAGDADFSSLMERPTVSAGATIDLAGFSTSMVELGGAGRIVSSSGAPALTLIDGDFSGTIAGPLSLTIEGDVELQGADAYSGATTIDGGSQLTLGPGGSIAAASQILDDDQLVLDNGGPLTLASAISGDGGVLVDGAGTVTIDDANTYAGATVVAGGGALAFGDDAALGSGEIVLDDGALLATASETLDNPFATESFGGAAAVTIAAATGKTLTMESASGCTLASGVALDFGETGDSGTVVWFSPSGSVNSGAAVAVDDGALKAGDGNFGDLVDATASEITTVASGATLDLGGFSATVADLQGAGTVTDSGGAATLTLDNPFGSSAFAGTISGPIVLTIAGRVTLTGADVSTGAITIESGDGLQLGAGDTGGTATGSIDAGSVIDNGFLFIDRSNAVSLAGSISGSGELYLQGDGVTTIDTANSYSGGTTVFSLGTLAIGAAGALGSGELGLLDGELEATRSLSLPNPLFIVDSPTIAAAHGATFTIGSSSGWTTNYGSITFGAAGQDGTVLWSDAAGDTIDNPGDYSIDVAAGTLRAADAGLNVLSSNASGVTVGAGATFDLGGFAAQVDGLGGAGTVTDSGAAATLTLADSSTFSGTISGALSLALETNVTFASRGRYVLTAGSGVAPTSGATGESFVDNGLFKQTAGAGVSTVSTPFTDDGEVAVTSGSIQFTDGFNFVGVVEGVLSQASVTTVSANAPGQTTFFAGSGDDLIEVTQAPTYVGGGSGFDTLEIAADMTLAAGSIDGVDAIEIDSGVTADLSHLFTGEADGIAGDIGGAGTLAFDHSATIGGDAFAFTVARWSISGAGTKVTFDENLGYGGRFQAGPGTILSLSAGPLLLSGGATFAGATVEGLQRLLASGTTAISGLAIGGTSVFENTKTVTQAGGELTIGDDGGDVAVLDNTAGAHYEITDDSGIGRGAAAGSHILNAGLLEKTGGTGVSTILPAVQNTGTLEAARGALDMKGAISGTGELTISGAAKLETDGAVGGGQTASFIGGGGEFVLGDALAFAGEIAGFGAHDTLDFGAPFSTGTTFRFSENSAGTSGALTLTHGSTKESFTLLGAYAQADFHASSSASGTLVTFV